MRHTRTIPKNESGQLCCDIIKVIFRSVMLLKAKRPGEYILPIFPNNISTCHRPHIMAGRSFPSVLLPCLSLLPRPAHTLFICWFVCCCCVVTQNTGAMPSNILPQSPGHLFELWNHTCIMICLVTLNKCSFSTMREVGGCEIIYSMGRGLITSSRQISFEFLLFKICPWTKLRIWFGFFTEQQVGIRSYFLSRDNF